MGLTLVAAMALFGCTAASQEAPVGAGENCSHYLGHPTSNQYSTLDQINTGNVGQLVEAWTYVTGDSAEFQANNLIVHGVLYTVTPTGKITALNGATGEHRWTFEPDTQGNPRCWGAIQTTVKQQGCSALGEYEGS
jgi:quinoprotein glucose dehydrogenase